jgi:hypothetical protein
MIMEPEVSYIWKARTAAFLAATGVYVAAARLIGSLCLPTYDDAFITFRYAENLANGVGFYYHAHEPVLGVTTPAFGLLLTLFSLTSFDLPTTSLILNIIVDILVGALTILVLSRAYDETTLIIFPALFAVSPILTRISVGGMEAMLFLFLSLAAIHLFTTGSGKGAIFISTLAYFVRPEAILLVALFCIGKAISGGVRQSLLLASMSLGLVLVP